MQRPWMCCQILEGNDCGLQLQEGGVSQNKDKTGAKQLFGNHSWGLRLPRTTMQHLVKSGFPFELSLIFESAIVGKGQPTIF